MSESPVNVAQTNCPNISTGTDFGRTMLLHTLQGHPVISNTIPSSEALDGGYRSHRVKQGYPPTKS